MESFILNPATRDWSLRRGRDVKAWLVSTRIYCPRWNKDPGRHQEDPGDTVLSEYQRKQVAKEEERKEQEPSWKDKLLHVSTTDKLKQLLQLKNPTNSWTNLPAQIGFQVQAEQTSLRQSSKSSGCTTLWLARLTWNAIAKWLVWFTEHLCRVWPKVPKVEIGKADWIDQL